MIMKKLFAIAILVFTFTFLPNIVFAENKLIVPDYSWYESKDKESYTISSEEQLVAFANIVNGKAEDIEKDTFNGRTVILSKNLDLTGIVWTPIGSSMYDHSPDSESTKMFEGTFDGRYHTIIGLSSKNYVALAEDISSGEHSYGLFGYAYGASVKNLNLEDVDIHCSGDAGADGAGVAAAIGFYIPKDNHSSVIDNVHVLSGKIHATNNMGGVIGYMEAGEGSKKIDVIIENCTNSAEVITDAREAGGILGLFQNAKDHSGSLKFINCINYGDVIAHPGSAATVASGILGKEQSYGNVEFKFIIYFENCINDGNVIANGKSGSGTETHAAGISTVYYVRGAPIIVTNCLNTGNVTITGSSVDNFIDGIIAHPSSNNSGEIKGILQNASYSTGQLNAPRSNTVFLKYDLNGAVGYEDPLRVNYGSSLTISNGANITREGYIFAGWNTKIDGTGAKYVGGENITIEESTTLYAQWKKDNGSWNVIVPPPQFYTGKPIKPSLLVYDSNDNIIDSSKYTVTYPKDEDCTDVGKKSVKVTYNNETLEVEYHIIKSRLNVRITAPSNELKGNETLELFVFGAETNNVEVICDDPEVVIEYSGNNVFNVVMPNKDKEYLFTVVTKDDKNNFKDSSSILVTGTKTEILENEDTNNKDETDNNESEDKEEVVVPDVEEPEIDDSKTDDNEEEKIENPITSDFRNTLLMISVVTLLLIVYLKNSKKIKRNQYERY